MLTKKFKKSVVLIVSKPHMQEGEREREKAN
jgi:hypothetical protein